MTDARFTGYGWRWAASMGRAPLHEVLQDDAPRRTMDWSSNCNCSTSS
jgi:hypothetical protein